MVICMEVTGPQQPCLAPLPGGNPVKTTFRSAGGSAGDKRRGWAEKVQPSVLSESSGSTALSCFPTTGPTLLRGREQ